MILVLPMIYLRVKDHTEPEDETLSVPVSFPFLSHTDLQMYSAVPTEEAKSAPPTEEKA
jgi:hypothetical protein